ncbi:MAG: gamma carbonic anhydrase family protein [Bacillota bacterium]|nr:gamma carbonic anhydrase family protein [Bacillota bacterium]MDW7677444.1 gamma carbonic anhydrase family protein [Bacillota bacterium]
MMIKANNGRSPTIHESCFVAETASVIGNVAMQESSSLWYGVVVRGDIQDVSIGTGTNIQDGTVVHVGYLEPTIIGDYVTVGHNAIVHGCSIDDRVLIGMGAIILNGATIGSDTILAAGSLVPKGKSIPSGVLAMGSPARIIRELSSDEIKQIKQAAEKYILIAQQHKQEMQDAE